MVYHELSQQGCHSSVTSASSANWVEQTSSWSECEILLVGLFSCRLLIYWKDTFKIVLLRNVLTMLVVTCLWDRPHWYIIYYVYNIYTKINNYIYIYTVDHCSAVITSMLWQRNLQSRHSSQKYNIFQVLMYICIYIFAFCCDILEFVQLILACVCGTTSNSLAIAVGIAGPISPPNQRPNTRSSKIAEIDQYL